MIHRLCGGSQAILRRADIHRLITLDLPMRLVLFQRDNCHLCDLALDLLARLRVPEFESVFIDDDVALEARYGERIPVLRNADSGGEIDWPFAPSAVVELLAEH
jgi:hypothetical protein